MKNISHDRYLGDIVSADGRNDQNINSRVSKGLGLVNQVMNMLEKVTFGSHYFTTAILFRESIFLSGILTNAESWHGLTKAHVEQLESVDRLLLRQIVCTPVSTPTEALFLELGILSIGTIIKTRRINYLHYLLKCDETEMVYKVFSVQWNRPVKNDWVLAVKQDLNDFQINEDFSSFRSKSSEAFKTFVKSKAIEYEFSRHMNLKTRENRSKMDDLNYHKLNIQEYLNLKTIHKQGAQILFKYRVRMAKYGENFRGSHGPVACPLCGLHLDNQKMAFENCPVIKANIQIVGSYSDIFSSCVNPELVKTLEKIEIFREKNIS